jgi:hypothetical protein
LSCGLIFMHRMKLTISQVLSAVLGSISNRFWLAVHFEKLK